MKRFILRIWYKIFPKEIEVPEEVVLPTTGGTIVVEPNTNTGINRELDLVNDGTPKNPDHKFLFDNLKIDDSAQEIVKRNCYLFKLNKSRYSNVTMATGVPEWFIFLLHLMECSLSFKEALHNGDEIIGTNKKTYRVPKNRGPFATWEQSAIDAIRFKKYDKITDWSLVKILPLFEKWNGLGYRSKIGDRGEIEYSPFILAYSNFHDETSKYVADGKYSKTAKTAQVGVYVNLKGLENAGLVELY